MRISDWSSDGCSSDLIEQALSRKRTSSARGGGSVTSSIRRTEISSDNSCTLMARIGVSPHFNVVWEKHRAIAWGRLDELQRLQNGDAAERDEDRRRRAAHELHEIGRAHV